MIFWLLTIAVTVIACAALFYAAAGRAVNAMSAGADAPVLAHFRLQLREIESDTALGRLGSEEALAAKGELAREVMRLESETAGKKPVENAPLRAIVLAAVAATALLAFGVYALLGKPDLPAAPLATRTDIPPAEMTLDAAIGRIEAQLQKNPGDVRGWTVIAPAYMELGRFADAAAALRRVIALDGPTADREADLGEALMLANDGSIEGEPLNLFRSASSRDPAHVRSRFYIAGELTRTGDFPAAIAEWKAMIALATGEEAWLATARTGLATAEAGLDPRTMPDADAIAGMVEGLAARLASDGGSIADWTKLVRSRLVLGQTSAAQTAYDAARKAFPDAAARTELDILAADNGLVASN